MFVKDLILWNKMLNVDVIPWTICPDVLPTFPLSELQQLSALYFMTFFFLSDFTVFSFYFLPRRHQRHRLGSDQDVFEAQEHRGQAEAVLHVNTYSVTTLQYLAWGFITGRSAGSSLPAPFHAPFRGRGFLLSHAVNHCRSDQIININFSSAGHRAFLFLFVHLFTCLFVYLSLVPSFDLSRASSSFLCGFFPVFF